MEKNNINIKTNNTEPNLYDILEIPIYSQAPIIKKAFRGLALKYHPDKKGIGNTSKNFITIKNAYDILSDDVLKNKYDNELKLIKIGDNLSIEKLNFHFVNFIKSTEFDKMLKLLSKKNNLFEKEFTENFTFLNYQNYNVDNIKNIVKKLIDIVVEINYTLEDIWNCVPKQINISRETKEIFSEIIYPIDLEQNYESEGEIIKINGKNYLGDLVVKINVINTTINGETYFIYDGELYILIKNNRIMSDRFKITFIDNNTYTFNIKKLKNITNNLGNVYFKKNFGLPILKIESDCDFNNVIKSNQIVSHGNLFFIFLI